MELVGIGFLGKDCGAVVIRECLLDGVDIVPEVEYEHVVFLGMGAVQP